MNLSECIENFSRNLKLKNVDEALKALDSIAEILKVSDKPDICANHLLEFYLFEYYYKTREWLTGYGRYELQKPYYQRIYRGQRSKWIKKQCNRSVRRYKGKIQNGGSYKKIDEFWWEMY